MTNIDSSAQMDETDHTQMDSLLRAEPRYKLISMLALRDLVCRRPGHEIEQSFAFGAVRGLLQARIASMASEERGSHGR